jgi:dTDP-4-dehydrorhamnose reductase
MILLLGSSGYVGSAFQNHLHASGLAFRALSLRAVASDKRTAFRESLARIEPSFVICAIGFTGKPNVDAAETRKLECVEANIVIPCMIAELCHQEGIPWGVVSSGCIYSGTRPDGKAFTEEDPPNFDFRHNNCSFYSGTKALAEEILEAYPNGYIWRLRIPFSEVDSPRNYLSKAMRFDRLLDVPNSISQIDEFTNACVECWQRRLPYGKYNVTNPGSISARELAEMLYSHGFRRDKEFQFFSNEAEFMRLAAKTPRPHCLLDSSKIMSFGIPLTEIHEAIHWCLDHWKATA